MNGRRQTTLFMPPVIERRPRRLLAHAVDAGLMESTPGARFECSRCGWESGWIPASDTDVRRGVPCPTCNTDKPPSEAS